MSKAEIIVEYNGKQDRYSSRSGLNFQALSAKHKLPIDYDCRKADCGICIVRILEGAENLTPAEARESDFLKAMHADDDERLACQCRYFGNVRISVDY